MQDVNLPKEDLLNAEGRNRMENFFYRVFIERGPTDGGKIVAKFAELSQVQRFLGSRACIKRRRGRKIAFKVASPRRGYAKGCNQNF